jgi:hypothetical protein
MFVLSLEGCGGSSIRTESRDVVPTTVMLGRRMTYLVTFEGKAEKTAEALEDHLDAVERIEDAVAVAAGLVRRALQTAGAGLIRFAEARASEDPRSALTPA